MPKAKSEQIVQVIVNPLAADGRAQKALTRLQALSQCSFEGYKSWSLTTTQGPRHACQLATTSSADVLVTVGGDGTFHEVINGLMARETQIRPIFAPIDFGTGGDLAKSLALPSGLDAAFALSANGETREMDVGEANVTTEEGAETRWFINVGGFGANGEVVRRANHGSKMLGGKATFISATLKTVFSYQAKTVQLRWRNGDSEWQTWQGPLLSCFLANGMYCGDGMKVTPAVRITDGRLRLVILSELSILQQIQHLPKLYNGEIHNIPKSLTSTCTEMEAAGLIGQRVEIDLDGELSGFLPASFRVHKEAISVRANWGKIDNAEED